MTDPAAGPPTASPERASVVEDFVDLFASPAQVFARRVTANPALPFIIVSALLVVLFFVNKNVMAGIFDAEMQKGFDAAMKANPQLTPEQLAQSRPFMEMTITLGTVVVMPMALLILGLVTFALGRALGGTLSYGTALMIASFAWVPRVVESVLVSVQGLALDTSGMTSHYQLSLGVARFLDPATSPIVLALLGRVDLITVWVTVLLVIGLVTAGKMPKGRAVAAGVLLWCVGAIPTLVSALRS